MGNKHAARTFQGGVEQLTGIRDFVVGTVRSYGGDAEDLWACELAVDEAAANAFEHAYKERGGPVSVSIQRDRNEVVISVTDWGIPFDPNQVPIPDITLPLEQRREGGLGLYMIRRVMKNVTFDFEPTRGNTITMRRALHSKNGRRK